MRAEAPVRPMAEAVRPPITLPFAEVPLPFERGHIDEGLLHVAGHELNHAIAAYNLGVPILGISVRPSGNSLGRTILAGHVSTESMKIIAAAGSVATHDGHARGYGSDLFKAGILSAYYGGMTVGAAREAATGILSDYSSEVRERAAQILAFMGSIASPDIPRILERARLEIELEEKGTLGQALFENSTPETPEMVKMQERTVIEDFGAQGYRIRYVVGEKVKKEEFVCLLCQGVNGHYDECTRRPENDDRVSEPSPFKKSGTIFNRKALPKLPRA